MEGNGGPIGFTGECWPGAFDAALADLSLHRPIEEAVPALLSHLLDAFSTTHGYITIADLAPRPAVSAGSGLWKDSQPGADPDPIPMLDPSTGMDAEHWVTGDSEQPSIAVMSASITVAGSVVGTLGLGFDRGGPEIDPVHTTQLLERFSHIVATASSTARLVETERSARQQEGAIVRAGQALSATLQLRDVLRAILSELRKVVPYDTASVQELRGDEMVIVGGHGIDMDVFEGNGFKATGGGVPNADVLGRREPVIVADILGDHPYWDFPHDAHEMSGVRCWLGVPMLFGNQCTGMLTLDMFQPGFYTDAHAQTALAFAAQAAIALQNARTFDLSRRELEERRRAEAGLLAANHKLKLRMNEIESLQSTLREQAVRDALTGLFNRRYLMETLHRELARCQRDAQPLSLALLDVDHFKQVNDTHGHEAGDRVLAAVGQFLSTQTRKGDAACRYGGEEFIVVLPNTSRISAVRRAEEWRQAFDGSSSPVGAHGPAITISVGVADSESAANGDDLVRAADSAMYKAKSGGRNRVVLAD